jgi:hypothetical protein
MSKYEEYRIKKGNLTSNETNIPIDFGLIFNEDGIFILELYASEKFDLHHFMKNEHIFNINQNYQLDCATEKNSLLLIDDLYVTTITPHMSKVELVCYGKMKHTKIKDFLQDQMNEKHNLYYLILEGLKMDFYNVTEQIKYRNGKEILDFTDFKSDHTVSLLRFENHPYNQIFYEDIKTGCTIVEFSDDSNATLFYEKFLEIRSDYIYALSLLNGAEVRIRKECTGSYFTVGKPDSEIVITYSFNKIKQQKLNKYIPLNNPSYRNENTLNQLFTFCFDNYVEWNKKIDLNTIVFYLNNSEQVKSINERVFIQMIALERLSTLYVRYLGETEEFLPSAENFKPIKNELFQVIEKYKKKFGNSYDIVKSKVGNLNQIKRLGTKEKMFKLVQDVNIPVTEPIENLINLVRDNTIHEGDIGKDKEALINYHLLDELNGLCAVWFDKRENCVGGGSQSREKV